MTSTGELILEKLKQEVDQPAKFRSLSPCVEIVKTLSDDPGQVKINDITMAVMKDVALTTRVLQVANTVKFNQTGQRVDSVSEAILVLGLGPIRSIAFSVMLVETLPSQSQKSSVRDMCLTAAVAGSITRLICEQGHIADPEFSYLVGSFIHFGKMLCYSLLPDLTHAYELLLKEGELGDHEAECKIFGMGFEEIGRRMAEHLGLPRSVTLFMDPRDAEQMPPPGQVNLAHATGVSFEICRILRTSKDSEEIETRLRELAMRRNGDFEGVDVMSVFYEAVQEIEQYYHCDPNSPLWGKVRKVVEIFEMPVTADEEKKERHPVDILRAGVMEMVGLLANPQKGLAQTLEPVCRIICQGLVGSCAVIALKSGPSFLALTGYGRSSDVVRRLLNVPVEKDTNDLASIALYSGKDIYIEDIRNVKLSRVIPLWVKMSDPDSFMMMPIIADEGHLALLYVERPSVPVGGKLPKEIAQEIATLKNLVVLAIRTK